MRPKFVLTALVILSVSSVASADYSTPGAGTSYTLADLAQIAPEVVQQETDFNFRILDKLTIAASDDLDFNPSNWPIDAYDGNTRCSA